MLDSLDFGPRLTVSLLAVGFLLVHVLTVNGDSVATDDQSVAVRRLVCLCWPCPDRCGAQARGQAPRTGVLLVLLLLATVRSCEWWRMP